MYKMDDGWTDERMDDFRDEVNRRFDDVDKRFDKFEGDVDRRFDGVDQRFDRFEDKVDRRFDEVGKRLEAFEDRFAALQRTLLVTNGAIVAGLIGVIATQI